MTCPSNQAVRVVWLSLGCWDDQALWSQKHTTFTVNNHSFGDVPVRKSRLEHLGNRKSGLALQHPSYRNCPVKTGGGSSTISLDSVSLFEEPSHYISLTISMGENHRKTIGKP